MDYRSSDVKTTPFDGQNPGTSGLRKSTAEFMRPHYTQNFIQSIFNYLGKSLHRSTLVVGGDGRYFCKEAAEIIVRMAAANKVSRVLVGRDGILSTPAASNLIRKHRAIGGILLTASHNPGGPDADFGIKFNTSNGGAAPSNITSDIHDLTREINVYKIVHNMKIDLGHNAANSCMVDDEPFSIEVIDPVSDYVLLMKEVFDFKVLRSLLKGGSNRPPFRILIDCMHGVTGPYAVAIFEKELGGGRGCVLNSVPLPDFGKGHPDPNLVHGRQLIDSIISGGYDFGAAFDGDGDRNMIIGEKGFFISPSDSLAMLAAHHHCIPYFLNHGLKGFARSMPTSRAIDRVAQDKGVPVYEVPTGWKFFCNLMDAGLVSLCGEESFGTGSSHIREKDGIWAALAWLSVVAHTFLSVESIAASHWIKYGRDFYVRHDWEGLTHKATEEVMLGIVPRIEAADPRLSWTFPPISGMVEAFDEGTKETVTIVAMQNFTYIDPIDKTTVRNQGLIFTLSNDSRIIFRVSGTGSTSATIRVYMERFMPGGQFLYNKDLVIEPLIRVYQDISNIQNITGMDGPTVIT